MLDLKLVNKSDSHQNTVIDVGGIRIGEQFTVMAGPCSVESEEQMDVIAKSVKESGASILRGGAYKPRTSPYAFQGLGLKGLMMLSEAGKKYDLPIITEVMDTRDVAEVCRYADIVQIGARNMNNYSLLKEVGKCDCPVMLKRGLCATMKEFLYCAEYIMMEGNPDVILCERGIRTPETYTRNVLDLGIVTSLKQVSHLPVVVDPSHATGRSELIEPMSLSAVMTGCDGLMIEVHPNPACALSDAKQQINPEQFSMLMKRVERTVKFRESLYD